MLTLGLHFVTPEGEREAFSIASPPGDAPSVLATPSAEHLGVCRHRSGDARRRLSGVRQCTQPRAGASMTASTTPFRTPANRSQRFTVMSC